MQVMVQKFGGTSVQSAENREHVIRHIREALVQEYKLVVVVSALGRKPDPYATDSLLGLVDFPTNTNSPRELDLLMSCGEVISSVVLSNELQKNHISTVALTGAQAGFVTNEDFNRAKIKEVNPSRILKELETHDVVVVAGFQGQSESGEITTIGRGGSDTSAAALGVALAAERIEIFTDVEGIMTADPRVVKNARPLDVVTYTEICNLAYQGAKVIHPRAVEIAMQGKIPMRIRSTYSEQLGTLVTSSRVHELGMDIPDRMITGIAHISPVTQIKVQTKESAYRVQSEVFKAMAEAGISVDFINISPTGVVYTVPENLTTKAIEILEMLGFHPEVTEGCAKVSAVGAGMSGVPGVASKIVQALTDSGVQILQSADSHTTIWVLVHNDDLVTAVNALHDVFDLSVTEELQES
ncbi:MULTISPECIES: aspartate kinase [Oceanobacillus]|uniref:Aspartokinase n=1 Tax=Oceanobacillus kimchii TaxID=746691 RepID=A0ABQ5TGQ3_9BACI|nr:MULTISPECIES: aspartate kinase [Oceanobacillus]MBT2598656.1 aspartate kinase [Oceanobacillus sp. ISL-74]MBT2651575.1 aspartate kinase [Oceanobacillus sp. ISL-73]MCT1576224.1 aspartate kinase [Oceanobacillus kimchii]MCT2135861.1 aspartate kinase [Oceanobacillus kimchii]OEH54713.1 aspartate kinase [Oceanobacillus sp. E9]